MKLAKFSRPSVTPPGLATWSRVHAPGTWSAGTLAAASHVSCGSGWRVWSSLVKSSVLITDFSAGVWCASGRLTVVLRAVQRRVAAVPEFPKEANISDARQRPEDLA